MTFHTKPQRVQKQLCIMLDKIGGIIKIHDRIRHLVLFHNG